MSRHYPTINLGKVVMRDVGSVYGPHQGKRAADASSAPSQPPAKRFQPATSAVPPAAAPETPGGTAAASVPKPKPKPKPKPTGSGSNVERGSAVVATGTATSPSKPNVPASANPPAPTSVSSITSNPPSNVIPKPPATPSTSTASSIVASAAASKQASSSKSAPGKKNPAQSSDPPPKLFCDLDGVLSDFSRKVRELCGVPPEQCERNFMWQRLSMVGNGGPAGFYDQLPWMPGGRALWRAIAPFAPTILTGTPKGNWAATQKRRWCARELGAEVPVRVCMARDKWLHCNKGAILIDDSREHEVRWLAQGGHFVHHTSTQSTLEALCDLGVPCDLAKLEEEMSGGVAGTYYQTESTAKPPRGGEADGACSISVSVEQQGSFSVDLSVVAVPSASNGAYGESHMTCETTTCFPASTCIAVQSLGYEDQGPVDATPDARTIFDDLLAP